MLTSGAPCSRADRRLGSQSMPELRAAARHHLLGHDVRPAGADRDVQVLGLVEALALGRVVAGELGLGHPLELEA